MNLNGGTSLSDGVYHMICGLNEEYQREFQAESALRSQPLDGLSLQDFLKDFDSSNLVVENDKLSLDYPNSIKRILHVCHAIHKQLIQLTLEQFNEQFGMDLDWTGSRKRILECIAMLKANDDSELVLCFLLLFSILEHSLGDTFLSVRVSKPCPTNLKELLVSKEIQDLIGENIAMATFVIAGPPQGVNLRNVLWHGFASGNEIPPQYGSFLVLMMVYIGRRLSSINIKRRQMITFSKLDDLLTIFPVIDSCSHLYAVSQVFNETAFVSPRVLPIWKRVLFYYKEQKYGYALVLLMPQLEHSLRRVFAWVNGCPERILTAESTTLYTTFDEMLAAFLPDGSENKLRTQLGDNVLQMLMDVLVHSEGPRIRDHLSHGEVNFDVVPRALCSHLICISVAFALHFSHDKSKSDENLKHLKYSVKIGQAIIESATDMGKCQSSNENEGIIDSKSSTCTTKQDSIGNYTAFSEVQSNSKNILQKTSIDSSSENTVHRDDFIGQLVHISSNYQSVYHPCQILKRELCSISKLFEDAVSIPCDLHGELSTWNNEKIERAWDVICSKKPMLFSDSSPILMIEPFCVRICELCSDMNIQTLYRPRRELEVVSLLRCIIQHCGSMIVQVLNTASQRYQQWQTKELRSRQRNNYKRLLSLLPFYQSTLKIALLVIVIELGSLQDKSTVQPSYIKFLKRLLQFSENLESLSSCTKNRWDDCQTVCEQLLELIVNHYTINT